MKSCFKVANVDTTVKPLSVPCLGAILLSQGSLRLSATERVTVALAAYTGLVIKISWL